MKGKFITFYGINNIGKSTHAKKIVDRLNADGKKTEFIKYPVYDIEPTGPILNKILRGNGGQKISEDELQMWFTINRYQYQPDLIKMLEEGVNVIAEDYVGTGIAWGMAKGLDQKWLESLNSHLLCEDFSILMEGERFLGAKEKAHVHEQNDDLVEKCKEVHRQLGVEYKWKKVRVDKNIKVTEKIIWDLVSSFLDK